MNQEINEIIEKSPKIYEIIKGCPYEILKKWQIKKVKKGEVVLRQGEVYDYFFIVARGIVDIYIMSEQGKKYSEAVYKEGDYIGELEIFERKPYSCFVEALSDVSLIYLQRDDFFKWIEMDNNINRYLMKTLCRQFYDLSMKAGEDTLYPLRKRICRYLLLKMTKKGKSYCVDFDKYKVSEQMAVTPRSINRVLKDLKEEGIILESNGNIEILEIKTLENEAKNNSNFS